MSDYKIVLLGTLSFFVAYFLCIIIEWINPLFMTVFENSTIMSSATSTMLQGVVWFGIIIIWFLSLIVMPSAIMGYGLKSGETQEQDMFSIIIAILWFIIALAISYFTYSWHTTFTSVITNNILQFMYWIGLFVLWIMNILVIPSYIIIHAKQESG